MKIEEFIAKRLSDLRNQKNLTVNALADKSGVAQSYIRDIEKGNKNITVERLDKLCETLEVSLQEFFNEGSSRIESDPLIQNLSKLTPIQRNYLLKFIESMNKPE